MCIGGNKVKQFAVYQIKGQSAIQAIEVTGLDESAEIETLISSATGFSPDGFYWMNTGVQTAQSAILDARRSGFRYISAEEKAAMLDGAGVE